MARYHATDVIYDDDRPRTLDDFLDLIGACTDDDCTRKHDHVLTDDQRAAVDAALDVIGTDLDTILERSRPADDFYYRSNVT